MNIKTNGKKTQGRNSWLKHMRDEKITRKGAMLAKCYDCCGGYIDGVVSCQVTKCPLFPFMPYRKNQ